MVEVLELTDKCFSAAGKTATLLFCQAEYHLSSHSPLRMQRSIADYQFTIKSSSMDTCMRRHERGVGSITWVFWDVG